MSRIALAFRSFFVALGSKEKAEQIRGALARGAPPKEIAAQKSPPPSALPAHPRPPVRSEAITLLAALQREARLVDLMKQPLTDFSDEQIGAAARNVLSECGAVLDRFFQLEPVAGTNENAPCDVPRGYDPAEYKLTGHVEGNGPFHGTLI